jgi:gas vesicle protein
MKGISLNSMGGTMTLNGEYASDAATPRLKGDVNIDNVLYSEVFRQITSARKLVPIFGKTKGRFHGNATFDTPLESDMKPNLTQLRAKGTISSNDITISGVEALHRLSKALKRDEFYDPEISHVSIPFEVKDGKVLTSNFSFYIADTKFNVENGYTSINENIDYTMHVDIPTSESTILKINKAGVRITGTISDPKVKVQTKEMIKEAGRTIKNNISTTVKTAANDIKEEWKEERAGMKEDWKESKENLKEDMKEAGSEIKNAFRSLFKKNQD